MEDKIDSDIYIYKIKVAIGLFVLTLLVVALFCLILLQPDRPDTKVPIQELKIPEVSSCMDSSCTVIFRSKECSIFMIKVEDSQGLTRQLYFSDNPSSDVYKSFLENQDHIRRAGW